MGRIHNVVSKDHRKTPTEKSLKKQKQEIHDHDRRDDNVDVQEGPHDIDYNDHDGDGVHLHKIQSSDIHEKPANISDGTIHDGTLQSSGSGLDDCSVVDEHTVAYYKRVLDSLDQEMDNTPEERELFFNNVFQQMETEALSISKHKITSHIVEKMLSHVSSVNLISFMRSLDGQWSQVLCDKFASHIVQSILDAAFTHIYGPSDDDFKEGIRIVGHICRVILNDLKTIITHTYGSHVVRTMLEVLTGVKVSESVLRSRFSRDQRRQNQLSISAASDSFRASKPQPKKFDILLKELTEKILKHDDLEDYVQSQMANPVLQTLFLVLKQANVEICHQYCKALVSSVGIFKKCSDFEVGPEMKVSLPDVVTNVTGSHFVEQLLRIMADDVIAEIFADWSARIVGLALHPTANFVLQKLMERLNVEQFSILYDVLKNHLEDLLAMNHLGLVVKLAECANRLGIKQKSLLKHVLKAFHCHSPAERQLMCVPLIISLTTYDVLYPDKDEEESDEGKKTLIREFNLHGSLLLQQMIMFGDPSLCVASALALPCDQLVKTAQNPIGGHLIEAFIRSKNVGEKNRDKLYGKLKDYYVDLACDKTGSRTFDALWAEASMYNKAVIAEELVKKEAKIKSDRFGQFIHQKCALQHFKQRRTEWESIISGQVKKRKMFDDLLVKEVSGEVSSSAKKPRNVHFTQKTGSSYAKISRQQPQISGAKKPIKEKSMESKKHNISLKKSDDSSRIASKRPSAKKRKRMKKMGLWGNV